VRSIHLGRPMIAAAIISCGISLIPAAALAAPARPAAQAAAAAVRHCTAAHTVAWLGIPGSGAAGSTFYPLEFSNVGHRTCWLYGYPGVSAISSSGRRIGPPASHAGRRHLVILRPGATAHAILQVVEAGNIAGCHARTAAGLKVYPPGQRRSTDIPGFSFPACSNRRVLGVGPVRAGTGIPGF
jgi:hypothetical protein